MRSIIIRIIIFIGVFTGALLLFNHTATKGKTEMTAEMNQASLPVLFFEVNGERMNALYGHTDNLDATLLKETVTPIGQGSDIQIFVKEYKNNIKSLKYELSNTNGTVVINSGTITELEKADGGKIAKIPMTKGMEDDSDYSLKISLKPNGGVTTNYYTRIKYGGNYHADSYIEFVNYFRETTFNKEKSEELVKFLETRIDGSNNNLNRVTIHSNLESVTWANLKPQIVSDPVIYMKELTDSTATLEVKYMVSAVNGKKTEEYYSVAEYYKVRYGEDRMYLLSFERKQERYFDPGILDTSRNAFKIGIASNEVKESTFTSSDCQKTAFVLNRQLWYYDYKNVDMVRVFSFRQDDVYEERNDYDQHDIHIIDMSEEGEVLFTVYGYMNRGRHEGTTGIALYQFTPENASIEELLYIPSGQPFQTMKEDATQLQYLSEDGNFYLIVDGVLHSIHTDTKEDVKLQKNLTTENCVVAGDHSMVAIQNKSLPENTTKIIVYNLKDGSQNEIAAKKGERLQTIGYIGSNLIYGIANKKDITKNTSSGTVFPMKTIKMLDEAGKEINTYKKSGIYVTSAKVNGQAVDLKRAKKSGNEYQETSSDIIIKKEEGSISQVTYSYNYNTDWYNQLYMIYPNFIYITQVPSLLTTKEVLIDDYRTVALTANTSNNKYYVYANGQVVNSYSRASEAIQEAALQGGFVVNSKQQYVWESNSTPEYYGVADDIAMVTTRNKEETAVACAAMILQYEKIEAEYTKLTMEELDVIGIMNSYMKNSAVDLTGCSLNQVLYFVGKESPVIARTIGGGHILITSYNSTKIRYSNPETGDVVQANRKDVENMISGKVFYSYVK